MTKKQTFGRSMLEMLGVLAIIGILSIGSLSVYRSAIKRIQMNRLNSWLEEIEFSLYDNCLMKGYGACYDLTYQEIRRILCNSMGSDFCDDNVKAVYVPLKFIPNIQWAVKFNDINNRDAFTVYLCQLTEEQCEDFLLMKLPENVSRVQTNDGSYNLNRREPILTEVQRRHLINKCKTGAQTNARWGGIFNLSFFIE